MIHITVTGTSAVPTRAFELIRAAADAYLSSERPERVHVSADELHAWLTTEPASRRPLVVDIRPPAAYHRGHIAGAVNIPLMSVLQPEGLALLPDDRPIVLVGDDGHQESQLVMVLNMLHYDVRVLRYGMPAWTRDRSVAPKRLDQPTMAAGYPLDARPAPLPPPGPLPALQTDAEDARTVILAAARACLEQGVPAHITPQELHTRLSAEAESAPFVLSLRKPEHYALGHIPGASNFYYVEAGRLDRLRTLPADRHIVVYCYIGHTSSQTAMLLRMLGYQVTNLAWGLAGWSTDESIAMAGFKESEHAHNYPLAR